MRPTREGSTTHKKSPPANELLKPPQIDPELAARNAVSLPPAPSLRPATLRQRMLSWAFRRYYRWRLERRWSALRAMGMQLGARVNLPLSVWIDTSHANLISIGDNCGFGDGCVILAHDAMSNEFLDATRIARVTIHESCHFGARTIILPGVEIGPRAIVGAGSVVTKSIPPDSVAAGNPARVLMSLEEFLARRKQALETAPLFRYEDMDPRLMTEERNRALRALLEGRDGFVFGGVAATLAGAGHLITS
ncbi:MAG: acyltransferase [Myxococcales bacterium]|jgi:maltose O-acetyltransferase